MTRLLCFADYLTFATLGLRSVPVLCSGCVTHCGYKDRCAVTDL